MKWKWNTEDNKNIVRDKSVCVQLRAKYMHFNTEVIICLLICNDVRNQVKERRALRVLLPCTFVGMFNTWINILYSGLKFGESREKKFIHKNAGKNLLWMDRKEYCASYTFLCKFLTCRQGFICQSGQGSKKCYIVHWWEGVSDPA